MNQLERNKTQQREEVEIKELKELVKIRIAPSKIHGVGVFAIRDIKKGERLHADIAPLLFKLRYTSFDKLPPEISQILLEQYPNIVNGSAFVWPTIRLQAYMNHGGDESNYSAMKDEMIKDTKTGEEITENYKMILGYEKVFKWLE